jgi:hypothetical protein
MCISAGAHLLLQQLHGAAGASEEHPINQAPLSTNLQRVRKAYRPGSAFLILVGATLMTCGIPATWLEAATPSRSSTSH